MDKPVVIITAASQGIGLACAKALAKRDYNLVLMSRSEKIETVAKDLNAVAMTGSVTETRDLQALVDLALHSFGRIDGIINNTGHPPKGDLLTLSDEDWRHSLDLLLLNVVRIARFAVPHLKYGSAIVNISTLGAVEPNLAFPISSALRAGLGAFTKLFADRYAKEGIRMNTLLPGFVDSYDVSEEIREQIPMKREAEAAEIAKAAAFLLSPGASYITGQSIRVDGGLGKSI